MKKLLTLCICALLGLSAMAQQLPNAGFEEAWVDCVPWTSARNEKVVTQKIDGKTVTGQQPTDWTISHVIGMSGTGSTLVGEKVAGYESESAVKVFNSKNPFMSSQKVPGYFTLGTTWSTAAVQMGLPPKISKADGGTFGGIEFADRPDAVNFDYMRTHGSTDAEEQATVVAYMWKGTYTQAEVPGEIKMNADPSTVTMINRDRNILGMTTETGKEVTWTEGAELIAKIDYAIMGNASSWVNKTIDFEYVTESVPEMFNIIFSAGNYWSPTPGDGNALTVDNVKLLYYSRLASLTVNGTEVILEDDKYEYEIDALPVSVDDVVAKVLGNSGSAKATVAIDEAAKTVTVKVENAQGKDIDGNTEHIYTLSLAAAPVEGEKYEGTVSIAMGGGEPIKQVSAIYINNTGDNTCTISLPNFALDLSGSGEPTTLGNIVVPDVKVSEKDGTKYYTGSVEDMPLADGSIHAGVTLNGIIDAEGNVNMNIPVIWYVDGDVTNKNDGNMVPIDVEFVAKNTPTGVDEIEAAGNGEVEYYNLQGIRVANPESGIYIRRQGSKVSKVYVK